MSADNLNLRLLIRNQRTQTLVPNDLLRMLLEEHATFSEADTSDHLPDYCPAYKAVAKLLEGKD